MPDLDNILGAHGEGFGLRSIVSDVSGAYGEGFGFSANSFLRVVNAAGQGISNVSFVLSWDGGSENIVGYDPAYLYLKTRVVDTPITVNFDGTPNLQPFTLTFTIPAAGFRRIDVVLEYRETFARITQKRYL